MTTTTRTTRKGPWAAALTALLAVLALVFGVMAFAAPASARSDPVTECAGVENYIGFDKIEFPGTTPSDPGGESGGTSGGASITYDPDSSSTGGWATTLRAELVVVKTGTSTPSATGYPGFGGTWSTGGQDLSHITFCYAGTDEPDPDKDVTLCHAPQGQEGNKYVQLTLPESGVLEGHQDHEFDIIPPFGEFTGLNWDTEGRAIYDAGCQRPDTATLTCTAGWTVSLFGYPPNRDVEVFLDGDSVYQDSITPSARIFEASGPTSFATGVHNLTVTVEKVEGPVVTAGPVDCTPKSDGGGGTPPVTPQVFTATQPYCAVADAAAGTYTTATLTATGDSQVTADAALKTQATALTTGIVPTFGVGNNEFTGLNWTTDGQTIFANGCVTPTAQIVAPVEAATVPVEEPETVAVPAPAKVAMPAAVPAGDGSTVPQVPVALLALLALATAAAVTSGLRLATNR